MAYTLFDPAKPASSQTGPQFAASANANDDALFDLIGAALLQGHAFSQSGGTAEEPTTLFFTNGARILKIGLSWSGGYLTQVAPNLSVNSGVSYDQIGSTATFTYDGSGNCVSSTNWGGLLLKLIEWIGKTKALRTSYNAHVATGTGAHSTGTMALQNANAVVITSGDAVLQSAGSKIKDYGSISAGTALDWKGGDVARVTVTGAGAAFNSDTNAPSSGEARSITLKVVNGGLATNLFPGYERPGGALTLTVSGHDWVTLLYEGGVGKVVLGAGKAYS